MSPFRFGQEDGELADAIGAESRRGGVEERCGESV
jgi:hypothetical protein